MPFYDKTNSKKEFSWSTLTVLAHELVQPVGSVEQLEPKKDKEGLLVSKDDVGTEHKKSETSREASSGDMVGSDQETSEVSEQASGDDNGAMVQDIGCRVQPLSIKEIVQHMDNLVSEAEETAKKDPTPENKTRAENMKKQVEQHKADFKQHYEFDTKDPAQTLFKEKVETLEIDFPTSILAVVGRTQVPYTDIDGKTEKDVGTSTTVVTLANMSEATQKETQVTCKDGTLRIYREADTTEMSETQYNHYVRIEITQIVAADAKRTKRDLTLATCDKDAKTNRVTGSIQNLSTSMDASANGESLRKMQLSSIAINRRTIPEVEYVRDADDLAEVTTPPAV